MSVTVQVIYPISDDTNFDYDYYNSTHSDLLAKHVGPHMERTLITKGLAGGPDTPPAFYAIATLVFKDQNAMNAGLAQADPVLADIANFTNSQPQMLIGEVIG